MRGNDSISCAVSGKLTFELRRKCDWDDTFLQLSVIAFLMRKTDNDFKFITLKCILDREFFFLIIPFKKDNFLTLVYLRLTFQVNEQKNFK